MERRLSVFVIGAICILLMLIGAAAYAVNEVKITPDDPELYDEFGRAVDVSGNFLIVGAPEDDDMGTRSGSAYIFKWETDTWIQDTKLVAPDGVGNAQFGYAVSIYGDHALVGAFRDNANGNQAGAAYIWRNIAGTWQYIQKLTPTVPEPNSEFGNDVSIYGDNAVIGAHFSEHLGSSVGAAYVFEMNGSSWSQTAKLVEDQLETSAKYGCSVDIAGNNVLIGAKMDDVAQTNAGAAYMYYHDGTNWNLQQVITASTMNTNDNFGVDVSLWQNWAMIGASAADGTAPDTGAAYMFYFDGTNWVQKQQLSPEPPSPDQSYGWSVAVSEGNAIAGAPWYSTESITSVGKAYLYTLVGSDWVFNTGVTADDMSVNAQLGMSVAVQSEHAYAGAHGALHSGIYSGAVYWYSDFVATVPTPTPTPAVLTYDISMYDVELRFEDLFDLQRFYHNPLTGFDVDEYIILDILDAYWFWPGWTETPEFETWTLPTSGGGQESILQFTWPYVEGEFEGIRFWGAFLTAGTADLLVYDMVEWSYSNK